jgi:uroporphyrin-III C-methyltransferase
MRKINHTDNTAAASPIGKVIFAGAGPGDPELMTLKTLRYLLKADVIIADRLISKEILRDFARKDALILPVGKQGRNNASTAQSAINGLLIEYATQGKLVVRLKGGDVSIFSNILDELQTLVAHQIPYEIVPGVTAALGAAAYAGIPLTARGYAASVRFLTYYKQDLLEESYWQELAQTPDTLVFYMSSAPLDHLVDKLLQYGIPQDRWLAIVEQATTPLQHVSSCPVHDYRPVAGDHKYASPSLIIIGKVAALASAFQWRSNSKSNDAWFEPISASPFDPPVTLKKAVC